MKTLKENDNYIIRLFKEEPVLASLAQFCKEHEIGSGCFTGIGAVKETRLGFYDLENKKYLEKTFQEEAELLNLTGNLSWFEDQPIVHAHAIMGDRNFQCFGGHLFEAKTAVTIEIYLSPRETKIHRLPDCEIGLNLLNL